jgi:hypothetical protein
MKAIAFAILYLGATIEALVAGASPGQEQKAGLIQFAAGLLFGLALCFAVLGW